MVSHDPGASRSGEIELRASNLGGAEVREDLIAASAGEVLQRAEAVDAGLREGAVADLAVRTADLADVGLREDERADSADSALKETADPAEPQLRSSDSEAPADEDQGVLEPQVLGSTGARPPAEPSSPAGPSDCPGPSQQVPSGSAAVPHCQVDDLPRLEDPEVFDVAREIRRHRRRAERWQRRALMGVPATDGEASGDHVALSVLVQVPDGSYAIGTEEEVKGGSRRFKEGQYVFAPALPDEADGPIALHISLPTPRSVERARPPWELVPPPPTVAMNMYDAAVYQRRKRTFAILLLMGAVFDILSYILLTVQQHSGKRTRGNDNIDGVPPPPTSIDDSYLSSPLFNTSSIASATIYLFLYLLLDTVGLYGTLYNRKNALAWYIVAETIATGLTAVAQLHPFLIFRLITVMLAWQVRGGLVQLEQSTSLLQAAEAQQDNLEEGGRLDDRAPIRARFAMFFPWVLA